MIQKLAEKLKTLKRELKSVDIALRPSDTESRLGGLELLAVSSLIQSTNPPTPSPERITRLEVLIVG